MTDEEMEIKTQQSSRCARAILACGRRPDRGAQGLATHILSEHGAHVVNYFGRFTTRPIDFRKE